MAYYEPFFATDITSPQFTMFTNAIHLFVFEKAATSFLK